MVAKVNTVAFTGIDVVEIEVQVHIGQGIPGINIVGLPDKAVGESKERIRAAFQSVGLSTPQRKVIVNLAPADIHKEGSHYDLAIALGILVELEVIKQEELNPYIVTGELSLDGSLNPVNGVLPAAIGANARGAGLVCPRDNAKEALWSGNNKILAPANLLEIVNHFKGEQILSQPELTTSNDNIVQYPDLKDVKGQLFAKRALEIAAAGGHNMLMIGPPGSGKSMLAKRLPGILPELSSEEILEISIIASVAGQLDRQSIIKSRPFRDPHSSASMPAMVGGGKNAKPGEVTLAHLGVLFLDELPEYSKNVLESLRQPLESGNISIARVNSHINYPAKFQLIAAMNPCKCGYLSEPNACSKAPKCGEDYQSRISGPLLDRFDIRVDVPQLNSFDIESSEEEGSAEVAKRVAIARQIQIDRYKGAGIKINAHADGEVLANAIKLNEECRELLKQAMEKFFISMRGYNRILRVARTIADLQNIPDVNKGHIAEAINFRMLRLKG